MLIILLMSLVYAAALGLGICFLIGFAVWLVFSRLHPAFRTIVFVATVLLIGSVAGEPWRREMPTEVFTGMISLAGLLVGIAFLMRHREINLFVATIVLLMIGYFPISKALESAGSPMYVNAGLPIVIAISLLLPFRLIGYRLLKLTGSVSDRDLELGTGIELDHWLATLHDAGAEHMTRPEIVSYIREQGVPFTWQKLLTDAYELGSGRRVVSCQVDGKPQTVRLAGGGHFPRVASGLLQMRSSISQWMGVTALIAAVWGIARHLNWQLPDAFGAWCLVVGTVSSGLIGASALYVGLNVSIPPPRWPWYRSTIHWSVVIAIAVVFPLLLGLGSQSLAYRIAAATLVFVAIWMSAILRLMRYEGYRLVWVQRVDPGRVFATSHSE